MQRTQNACKVVTGSERENTGGGGVYHDLACRTLVVRPSKRVPGRGWKVQVPARTEQRFCPNSVPKFSFSLLWCDDVFVL